MDDITQRLTDAAQGKLPVTSAMLIDARTEIERLRMAGAQEVIAETKFRRAYEWLSACCNHFEDCDIQPKENFARRHLIDICEQIADNHRNHADDVEGTVIELAIEDGKAIVSIQMSPESARKLPLYDEVRIIA